MAAGLLRTNLFAATSLSGIAQIPADSVLRPLQNTWPRWQTARALAEEFLGLETMPPVGDANALRTTRQRWEAYQDKIAAAKLEASSAVAPLVDERSRRLKQQAMEADARAEADAAADEIKSEFSAGQLDACRTHATAWLAKHGAADLSLASDVKSLARRAEFQSEAQQLRARVKTATPGQREAALAAFLDHFGQGELLGDGELAMLANCRRHVAKLRAEAAAGEHLRAAEESIARVSAPLPAGFGERLTQAAAILEKYPEESVKALLRRNVATWLEESLPVKRSEEHPTLQEAETKDGRILRGFFREVQEGEATTGYKRYDTWQEYQNPTADVGAWPIAALVSPPAAALPSRLLRRYNDQRARLLAEPDRRERWEEFSAACRQLEAATSRYRDKPGAATEGLSFRGESEFADRVLSGTTLTKLKNIW